MSSQKLHLMDLNGNHVFLQNEMYFKFPTNLVPKMSSGVSFGGELQGSLGNRIKSQYEIIQLFPIRVLETTIIK